MTDLFRQSQMFETPEDEREARQTWRTPLKLFLGLTARYGFELDAAADASNFKCAPWLGEEDDAPNCRWAIDGVPARTWWNPPFSSAERWARAARRERQLGSLSVGLVCASLNALWWVDKALPYCEFWTFRGRVQYVPPPGITNRSGNDRDSILMVFDPEGPTNSFGGVLCPETGRIIRRAS